MTARHCAAPMWENPEMMPGEWAVLTRYQVPCNASTAQPWSFRDYLQVCDTSGVRCAYCAANLPAWARYSSAWTARFRVWPDTQPPFILLPRVCQCCSRTRKRMSWSWSSSRTSHPLGAS